MMYQEPDKNLERLIHQRLRALPEMEAPDNLVQDVMKKIEARRAAVWWKRAWPEWPRGMQILSAALLLGLLGSVFAFHDSILASINELISRITAGSQFLKPIWTLIETLLQVGQILAGSIKSQIMIIGMVVVGMLYLSTIGLGTMVYRVVAGKN